MSVLHEVAGATVAGRLSDAFPVTVLLHLSTNVADHGAEVTDTETSLSFVLSESLAGGEVVDALSLLSKSVARHSVFSFVKSFIKFFSGLVSVVPRTTVGENQHGGNPKTDKGSKFGIRLIDVNRKAD